MEKAWLEIIAVTHAGMTTDEFARIVQEWITTAKHPQTGRLYTEMVYQPMVELLTYLRSQRFQDVHRLLAAGSSSCVAWTERVYGIPPEQVIGSVGKLKLGSRDGKPVLIKLPEVDFIDDKEGKPVEIQSRIGRRPIAAFGNSDGDLQMLQWTMAGSGRGSPSSFITTTRNANLPTTGPTSSSSSTKVGTRQSRRAGPS